MEEDVFPQEGVANEAAVRLNMLRRLYQKGNAIYTSLPEEEQAAFFQIVLMKIHAAYYTGAMYYFADRSALCVKCLENREAADCVTFSRYFEDLRRRMLIYYNEKMSGGKWNGIVTPEDYPPPRTAMYPAAVSPLDLTSDSDLSASSCTGICSAVEIPQKEVFAPSIDFGGNAGAIEGTSPVSAVAIRADSIIRQEIRTEDFSIDIGENAGEGEILAQRKDGVAEQSSGWREIKCLGRGGGSLLEAQTKGAFITYPVTLPADGCYELEVHRYPSLNSVGQIRVLVRVDKDAEQLLETASNDEWRGTWERNTMDQVDRLYLKLPYMCAGPHVVHIDAFSAWAQTPFAFSSNYDWQCCASESYQRSGLAMHIREKDRCWNSTDDAPALQYRFICSGGAYVIWALTYITSEKNGRFALCLDGIPVPSKRLYRGGNLWKYEAEHIWRLTPIAKVDLEEGEHWIKFSAFASGIRIDRFLIQNSGYAFCYNLVQ